MIFAERNISLRCDVDMLDNARSGNFLGQVKLMTQYDSLMTEHVRTTFEPGHLRHPELN
jgi:hypothetical protein